MQQYACLLLSRQMKNNGKYATFMIRGCRNTHELRCAIRMAIRGNKLCVLGRIRNNTILFLSKQQKYGTVRCIFIKKIRAYKHVYFCPAMMEIWNICSFSTRRETFIRMNAMARSSPKTNVLLHVLL